MNLLMGAYVRVTGGDGCSQNLSAPAIVFVGRRYGNIAKMCYHDFFLTMKFFSKTAAAVVEKN
jgi:hypothetical protein